jgi:hypothetical protein
MGEQQKWKMGEQRSKEKHVRWIKEKGAGGRQNVQIQTRGGGTYTGARHQHAAKTDDIMRKRKNATSATVLRLLDKSTHDRTEQSTGANGVLHTAPACYGGEPMANWNLPRG